MKQKSYPPSVIRLSEAIDVAKLPWVLYIDRKELPAYAGIYFVGTDEEPTAYIGRSECFKTRFCDHHRKAAFEQLAVECGDRRVKVRYWKAPLGPKDETRQFLIQLEDCLIKKSETRFNFTAVTPPKQGLSVIRRTYKGPIYVQLNRLCDYSVEQLSDSEAGCYFSHQKYSMAENATKYRSPVFLISSGTWDDALYEYGELEPEWRQYPTLYFLEVKFRARRIEHFGGENEQEYLLCGDQVTFHREFLNELSGFKDFSVKHLRTGLTNCSSSDFCETLLKLIRN